MDISSATFLCYNKSSPPHSREFEFQMSAPLEREPITSPADELFYKGKLLPLHLPPRLQMVQKLLQSSNILAHGKKSESFDDSVITTINNTNTATATPSESCNVSPATSCYASGELHAVDYYFECSAELVRSHSKKSWSKKLKFMRQSSLSLKLKASKAFLKSLFTKSGCSDEKHAVTKVKECSNSHLMSGKKNPFGQIQREKMVVTHNNATTMRSIDEEKTKVEDCSHRRSFSGAIKWHSSTKYSSASSSCSSSNSSSFSSMNLHGLFGPPMLKRSSSVNSDMENSIQGAIAYCKKSQQLVSARKSVSDVGFCSLTATRIAADCEKQEKPDLCRG